MRNYNKRSFQKFVILSCTIHRNINVLLYLEIIQEFSMHSITFRDFPLDNVLFKVDNYICMCPFFLEQPICWFAENSNHWLPTLYTPCLSEFSNVIYQAIKI